MARKNFSDFFDIDSPFPPTNLKRTPIRTNEFPLPVGDPIELSQPDSIRGFNSYSGTDIRALIAMPSADGEPPTFKVLANLQTISYSIFREKHPVRALGHVGEKGRTRGTRTIAGSMVFTVFDRHVLFDMLRRHPGDPAPNAVTPEQLSDLAYVMVDQLPPFDVVIHFANEYGHTSELVIFGVEISSEGQVMSIEDLITENTVQYTASHLALMRPGGFEKITQHNFESKHLTSFTSIMNSNASAAVQQLVRKSHNPFR